MWTFRIKFVILLPLLITLFSSCNSKVEELKKEYRLSADDLLWNIYHTGDTIKFLSNYNNCRMYRVHNIYHTINEIHTSNDWYDFEVIDVGLNRVDSVFYPTTITMAFVRGSPEDPQKGFLVEVTWYNDIELGIFDMPRHPDVDTLSVNNILYEDVYSYSNSNYTVYYQKQKGWLRIKNNSGETWDRIN